MNKTETLEIFRKFGVIIPDGHFVYASGKHGSVYLEKRRIYADIGTVCLLCLSIAKKFSGTEIDTVVGPEKGAVILSRWTARCLSKITGHKVRGVSAQKVAGGFAIRPTDQKKIHGRCVLVVEDILNTYGTVNKIVELVRYEGGFVIGIGALCDRSDPKHRQKIFSKPRTIALARMPLKAWNEEKCPLCAKGIPINTTLGKGKEFLLRKKQ